MSKPRAAEVVRGRVAAADGVSRAPGVLRIAVIGAGAAGILTAVHLLREAAAGELEILLVDRDGSFGPGLAYRTADPLHLLNVPACRMGGVSGQPAHFHDWLVRRGEDLGPEAFVPRGVYGEYLRELLAGADEESSAGRAWLTRLHGEVTSLEVTAGGVGVGLAGGGGFLADRAVLALGPLPGGDPTEIPEALRSTVYVEDPWVPGALAEARADESVLVVGTGLSMVDVVLGLTGVDRGPTVHAVSRHGLVPKRHRADLTRIEQFPVPLESGELEPVVAAMLDQLGRVVGQGGDWRDVIDSMRSETPAIWRALKIEEKRSFLADLQRHWDVHRFRMAPEVADRLAELRSQGRVLVRTRAIASLEPTERGARARLLEVGGGEVESIDVDRVINCTGSGHDVNRHAPPLVADLIATRLARPDPLSLGLDVTPGGPLVDATGVPSDRIFVVGALRKGVEWEAIGITEIRDQAAAAASRALGFASRVEVAG